VISEAFPYQKQRRRVLGREMAYVEVGQGDPIVLLHGNPTSSYLWRNVLPYLQPLGRCIAPDLVGMGDSDKLPDSGPGSYRFVEHRRYLDALLEALDVRERVTLVLHDWGSGLGFDWANRHRDAVKGIAFMEAITGPQGKDHWDSMGMRPVLEALRGDAGEKMVLEENFFIEEILPKAIIRPLTDAEMAEYRRPFTTPGEDRRPTLTWPPDRGRACRCSRGGSGLCGLAPNKRLPQAVLQGRARRDPDERHPLGRGPFVAEPDGIDRQRHSLRAGGFSTRDRAGDRRMDESAPVKATTGLGGL